MTGAERVTAGAASSTESDLNALLDAQRSAFARHSPQYAERLDALRRLERALLGRQDEIAAAIAQDFGGRSAVETRALELVPLVNEIRYACRNLKRWMAPRSTAVQWPTWPAKGRVIYQPLGVVGIVSPWNYPCFLSLAPLVGALAAGNHALLKLSELVPVTADLVKSMIGELYAPEYVSVVTGDAQTAAAFVKLPFDHLLFTGSTRVGKLVMQAASESLVPVTLELGGKSPALIHPDYPLQKAVTRILTGKLYNAGQTCIAPDYVLVPQHRRAEFLKEAQQAIARMYPTLVKNRDYTRIINSHHYRRLAGLVEDAGRLGADIIDVNPGAEVCDEVNRVFPPTMLVNIRDEMAVAQEEIFGPVLPIIEYRDIEEAIAYVNKRPHPLAFYYFDDNKERVRDIVGRVAAGGVTVNDCIFHVGQTRLPFGGVGSSGMGRYHGFDGFETFSNKKGVMLQARWSPLALIRPPYGPATSRILKLLLRA